MKKFFAGLLAVFYILVFFPVALAFGLAQTFFNENFYQGDFVDVMYEFAVYEIPNHIDDGLKVQFGLEDDDVKDILRNVFDRDDLSLIINAFAEEIRSATVDSDGDLELRFPLRWLTNKNEVVADELAKYYANSLQRSDIDREVVKSQIKGSLDGGVLNNIPEEFGYTVSVPTVFEGNVFEFFSRLANLFFVLGSLLLGLLLLVIGLIIHMPWRRVLRWEARTVFFGAFIFLLTLLTFLFLPKGIVPPEDVIYLRFYSFMMSSLIRSVSYFLFPILFVSFGLWVYCIVADKGK